MGIGARVTMGYLALIAVIVLVMIYQATLVGGMQAINQHLFQVNYPVGLAAVQLRNDLYEIDDTMSRVFVVGDPGDYAEFLEDTLDNFRAKVARLQSLGLSGPEEQEVNRLGEVAAALATRMAPVLEQPDAEAPQMLQDDLHRLIGQLENQTEVLISASREAIEAEVAKSEATFDRVRFLSLVGFAVALVLGLTIAFLIARSIAAPVKQLTKATRGLAEGDFSYQVDDSGNDEVAELARHFNAMVRRLNELDQLKGDFVSHVSHELKAPLASMQETTSLLLEEIPGPVNPKQGRLLELNLQSGRRLSAMINNLLDLSRLESGVMDYDYQANDLTALAEEVVAEMEPLASERECVLQLDAPTRRLWSSCDAGRILQVLRNLIDNGLKFSPPGASIRVQVRACETVPGEIPESAQSRIVPSNDGYAEIAIFDQGPGVAEEHKERIFDKFHQVKRGRKVSGQGVGLGLAISRTIIDSHGGALWVVDNEPKGSVFKLLLAMGERRPKESTALV